MQIHPQISEMSLADIPAVFEIEKTVHYDYWSETILQNCLKAGYSGWCLKQEEAYLGYVIVSFVDDEAHILNFAIAHAFQRQGHGNHLLQYVLSVCDARQSVTSLFLEVRRTNAAALALYRKAGFLEVGCRKGYYPGPLGREDALVLSRVLRKP